MTLPLVLVSLLATAVPPSDEARALLARGDVSAAQQLAQERLADSDRPIRAAVDLAEAVALAGSPQRALGAAREREARDPGRGLPDLVEGVLARTRRDPQRGVALLERALDRQRARADAETLVVREQLAFAFQEAGRYREARALHERNMRAGDRIAAIAAAHGAAYCAIPAKEYVVAQRLAERAARDARTLALPLHEGHAEAVLATLRWVALDVDGLTAHLQAALRAYESARRPALQASCLRKLAATDLGRESFAAAIDGLWRARALALAAGDVREASFCLEHLGSANRDLGDD